MVISRGFGDSTVQARGQGFRSEVQFTRPDNTTAYTALDVVGSATSSIHEFTQVGPRGGDLIVFAAELMINLAAVPSGMAGFRLHMYSSSPTAILDNAAFNLVSGDRDAYMGYAEFGTPEDLGSTLFSQARFVYAEAQLASGVTSIWGQLQTIGAYTPTALEGYRVRLRTVEI